MVKTLNNLLTSSPEAFSKFQQAVSLLGSATANQPITSEVFETILERLRERHSKSANKPSVWVEIRLGHLNARPITLNSLNGFSLFRPRVQEWIASRTDGRDERLDQKLDRIFNRTDIKDLQSSDFRDMIKREGIGTYGLIEVCAVIAIFNAAREMEVATTTPNSKAASHQSQPQGVASCAERLLAITSSNPAADQYAVAEMQKLLARVQNRFFRKREPK